MCEPVTIATLAIAAVSAVMSAKQADDKAKADNAFRTRQAQNDRTAAGNAMRFETNSILLNQLAKEEGTSQEAIAAATKGQRARSTARVAAGEAGVAGLSIKALQRDFSSSEARYR